MPLPTHTHPPPGLNSPSLRCLPSSVSITYANQTPPITNPHDRSRTPQTPLLKNTKNGRHHLSSRQLRALGQLLLLHNHLASLQPCFPAPRIRKLPARPHEHRSPPPHRLPLAFDPRYGESMDLWSPRHDYQTTIHTFRCGLRRVDLAER